ncbi:PLC-like phosphodiesterase [Trichodelitschia bisporula]|uniref:PLC-like phosphodiesterase n=1 Tax=Trichodelitschia bisporula TaxID=703511 RepID=A0A6G1HPI9_9PEZI|nr:PLC-like phosphodiesterase [Trichodelitschia bisporula]
MASSSSPETFPLLAKYAPPLVKYIPPIFSRKNMEKLGEAPAPLGHSPAFPIPSFTRALPPTKQTPLQTPQAIAHRGLKAHYPENTMLGFRAALAAGAHALETDIHLARDGTVVLAHDPSLKRCFGREGKIADYDWPELAEMRTAATPPQPMPRLDEFLIWLAEEQNEAVWVLLDVKMDDVADVLMRRVAETITSVAVREGARPWTERIVLGIWATKYLPICNTRLPGFPVAHIGFSTTYAGQFFAVPNIAFNLLQISLYGPFGGAFVRKARRLGRPVYAWTVNEERRMRFGLRQGLDGIITDDVGAYLRVRDEWVRRRVEGSEEGLVGERVQKVKGDEVWWSWKDVVDAIKIQGLAVVFLLLIRWHFGWGVERKFVMQSVAVG